jgi:hypothetical protein
VNINGDKVKITKNDGTYTTNIIINASDISEELLSIKCYGDFYLCGEGFLNFIAFDRKSLIDDNIIKLDGAFKGSIRKNCSFNSLLLSNLENVFDMSKVELNNDNNIEDLIKDEIIICELNWEDNRIAVNENDVDKLINSVFAHASFCESILLTNPRNLLRNDIKEKTSRTETNIKVKLIKDDEPMHYFLSAEKIEYPHLQYLEYYHVLEYYFLHKRMEDMEKVIKEVVSIELSGSKPTNESHYYDKMTEFMSFYFGRDENNELYQLEHIINNDLGYSLIKDLINNQEFDIAFLKKEVFGLDETAIEIKSVCKAEGGKNKIVAVKDQTIRKVFCDGIARRIYRIRNIIVHTKKFEKKSLFVPNNANFDILRKDIDLIRMLAFSLMTKK